MNRYTAWFSLCFFSLCSLCLCGSFCFATPPPPVTALAYAPDGKFFAAGVYRDALTVAIVSVFTGRPVRHDVAITGEDVQQLTDILAGRVPHAQEET